MVEELKVGQVWMTLNGRAEIVAVGPNFIGYKKVPGGAGIATIEYFRRASAYLCPPKPAKHELWVNAIGFPGTALGVWYQPCESRQAADHGAAHSEGRRIACVKVEYEEGEGL